MGMPKTAKHEKHCGTVHENKSYLGSHRVYREVLFQEVEQATEPPHAPALPLYILTPKSFPNIIYESFLFSFAAEQTTFQNYAYLAVCCKKKWGFYIFHL